MKARYTGVEFHSYIKHLQTRPDGPKKTLYRIYRREYFLKKFYICFYI